MKILVLFLTFFFTACYINERGISSRYYNDCKEYYDAAGVYHKACDENIIDFADTKKIWSDDKKSAIDAETQAKAAQIEADEKELDKVEEELEKQEAAKKEATKSEPK